MTRIRLALALVAVGLGVPIVLLAWRALEGLALERAIRHQAVAERAFDEMERALSTWLEAEEARPFEHYRFYVSPDERSPLSQSPERDFVVGAFQVDPDGSVHTPMRPRDPVAATRRGDWPPPAAAEQAIAQVTRLVEETWREEAREKFRDDAPRASLDLDAQLEQRDRKGSKAGEPGAPLPVEPKARELAREVKRQDPGTTRPIGGRLARKDALALKKELAEGDVGDEAQAAGDTSVYEVLQGFNRGADARAQRKQKVFAAAKLPEALPQAPAVSPVSPGPMGAAAPAESEAVREVPLPELPTQQLRALGYVISESVPQRLARANAPAEATAAQGDLALREEVDSVRVALDPMVARPLGDTHLLLYRTVLVGEQGFRQGLVLDRAKLGSWLSRRALEPGGLGRVASVRFDTRAADPSGGAFVFEHRFAEPFDALSARLSLAALSGVGSPGNIYALVALLFVVGAAGLFAIHRMVGVAMHFAERRSNFVSAVTHELKTPLTAIRMYGEMLRDGLVPSDEKRNEYYETITDESERLSRLIDNVLEFSRLERGTREMNCSVGPLGPVVREAAEKLGAHVAREGFVLDVEIEADLPPVRYDRDALLQVLFNLVDNAMKYAGAATHRRVVLEARRRSGGVELSVRDFGPGVPGRHLSRIFEPFYRGEDERVRSTKGTGIGLALVRDLAERMGAAVGGANADGGGFRVCLAFEPAEV